MRFDAAGASRTRWISRALLVLLTLVLTGCLLRVQMPAALVLGPMASGILLALTRPGLQMPPWTTIVAQATLGCLIARAVSAGLLASLVPAWPLLLGMNILSTVLIMALGFLAAKRRWLPGTAAIWGMSPGGASAMVMLSQAYGGDQRLVALMQYLRLVAAALAVVLVAAVFGHPLHADALALPGGAHTAWLEPPAATPLAATLALAAAAVALSMWLERPALIIFVPVFLGTAMQVTGWVRLEVPPLAAAAAFGLIGWQVGLGFTRASLVDSARLLPRILGGIVAILLVCAALAAMLSVLMGIDFVTAYMALNPGGMDTVMLVAASVRVDLPLVLAMQISRLILVMLIAPALGRAAATHHLKSRRPTAARPP